MRYIKFVIAIILLTILNCRVIWAAGTATFSDNSTNEIGWIFYINKADGSAPEFVAVTSTTVSTMGPVTIPLSTLDPGDCVMVSAYNSGGASMWSNRSCVTAAPTALPNQPTSNVAK